MHTRHFRPMHQKLTRLAIALVFLSALLCLPAAQPKALAQDTAHALAAPQTEALGFVSQFGGATNDAAVAGSTLYVGVGPHLVIMDVTNPAAPVILGQTNELYDEVTTVTISGSYAYVGVDYYGMLVFDISNPAAPLQVGSYLTNGGAYEIAVASYTTYLANGYGLMILNTTNLNSITRTGLYTDTVDGAYSVVISDTVAFVGMGYAGLHTVNITDPSHPTRLGTYTATPAFDVEVHNRYAYVAASDDGLRIVDILNPSNPVQVGYYESGLSDVYGLTVVGSYAYLANNDQGLYIVNVTNPASPTSAGHCNTPEGWAGDVTVAGSYAYISAWDIGLVIMNISSPASPSQIYWYDTPTDVYDIALVGDYAFLADFEDGVYSIDVSNPANSLKADQYWESETVAYALTISNTLAYVAFGLDGLRILDIADPHNLAKVSSLGIAGSDKILDVAVSGSYAYLAAGTTGLHIVNISTPAAPVKVGTCNTPGYASGVAVLGRYAYVSDRASGLRIIDVNNPAAPVEVGYYVHTPYWLSTTILNYPYAYLGIGDVLDISNPTAPVLVGSFTSQATVSHMSLYGNTLYVPRYEKGLSTMDLTADPTHPALTFTLPTRGYAMSAERLGSYIYVANGGGGLLVLNAYANHAVYLPFVRR